MRPEPVHVWMIPTSLPDPLPDRLAHLLDPAERERAGTYPPGRHRRGYVVAHGVARLILAGHLGVRLRAIRWSRGRYGKPELAGAPDRLRVNLSHSGALVALVAVRDRAVGVDVQETVPAARAARLADRFYPAAEARLVRAVHGARRAGRFTRLWARKEAWVKAAGLRLVDGLPVGVHRAGVPGGAVLADPAGRVGETRVRDLPAPPGYHAAVAAAGADPVVLVLHRWPGEGLGGWDPGPGRRDGPSGTPEPLGYRRGARPATRHREHTGSRADRTGNAPAGHLRSAMTTPAGHLRSAMTTLPAGVPARQGSGR